MVDDTSVIESPTAEADWQSKANVQLVSLRTLIGVGLILGIILPWGIWYIFHEAAPDPRERLEEALQHLHDGHTQIAFQMAAELIQDQYMDPEINGSLEYIVGMYHFRRANAIEAERPGRGQNAYDLASQFLTVARTKSPSSQFVNPITLRHALGTSHFKLGQYRPSLNELDSILDQYPDESTNVLIMYATCMADTNILKGSLDVPEDTTKANKLRESIVERLRGSLVEINLSTSQLIEIRYLYAEFLRQLAQYDEAHKVIGKFQQEVTDSLLEEAEKYHHRDRARILKARVFLGSGQPEKSIEILNQMLAGISGLERKSSLEAQYLLGRCYAEMSNFDQAIDVLEMPAHSNLPDISFPANLYAGEISRLKGLHEEALSYYLRALRDVNDPNLFTNSWIDLSLARKMVREAWEHWGNSDKPEHFRYAAELSEKLVPLFPIDFANELAAKANLKRAEIFQQQVEQQDTLADQKQLYQVREQWVRAADSYAKLASSRVASSNYADSLWTAAQMYRRGHEFEKSLNLLNRFIDLRPREGLPAALILKSQLLIDLAVINGDESIKESIQILNRFLEEYPKDQNIYVAQLLLGQANLELGQPDQAITIWRNLIAGSRLTPNASEWQSALFLLGRTLFLNASGHRSIVEPDETNQQESSSPELYQQVDEAIRWLDEFVDRSPNHDRIIEAEWLLAKGLQMRAQLPISRLSSAETVNAKKELEQEIQDLYQRSLVQFERLRKTLNRDAELGLLDSTAEYIYRDAHFEPAHIYFDLGSFDDTGNSYRMAIDLYSNAAFHFSSDPIVLIAYYRIAECYRKLNSITEARRQLEQARVILQKFDEEFTRSASNFSKEEWEQIFQRSIRLYDLILENS